MDPLFPNIPEDFSALSDDEVQAYIDATRETIRDVVAAPENFVGEDRTQEELVAELSAGRDSVRDATAALASRSETSDTDEGDDADTGGETLADASAEDLAAAVAAFADDDTDDTTADGDEADGDADGDADTSAEAETADVVETVTAAAPKPKRPARTPSRSRASVPRETARARVPLLASASAAGVQAGDEIDRMTLATMMQEKRRDMGRIPSGTKGDKVRLGRWDYAEVYPEAQTLTAAGGHGSDQAKIDAATDEAAIIENFQKRRDAARSEGQVALLASGGLCAPVTPYYQLQMISVPDRPVRAALPAFNADRGGINAALPLSLASITTAVGTKTAAQDAAGGSSAEKTCQVIDCPDFVETNVEIIYHCIQFGNLGARTFPERVAQSNDLVLAAHARTAESLLLTNMQTASTAVTAASLGYGVIGDLLGQVLTAAAGMRSRHRMNPNAVLRAMFPRWLLDEMLSDVIRSQFQRFDMTAESFIGVLREAGIEPTFYIDGPAGGSQVYGAQAPGDLLAFPANVVWFIYPEGSFLYLDGGTLELGIVRDSVLNSTNDFQIFGETFENVAFVGVESLVVTSPVCDSGVVAAPATISTCGDYS